MKLGSSQGVGERWNTGLELIMKDTKFRVSTLHGQLPSQLYTLQR